MATSSIANVIAAYAQTARSIANGGSAETTDSTAGAAGTEGADFASFLKEGAQAAIDAGKKSEEQSKLAMVGKADIRDVVSAVNNAEVTLQAVVAVRDKVVGAYNDILKMSI